MMKGWKTWAGAGFMAAGAVLPYLGYPELGAAVMKVGGALGVVGVAHKIEKAAR